MALTDYRGPANDPDVFRHLVGEQIVACFRLLDGAGGHVETYFVVASGYAIVITSNGAFWCESKETVAAHVAKRRVEIECKLAELRDLPGVILP